jgi:predicted sulfurtransferase
MNKSVKFTILGLMVIIISILFTGMKIDITNITSEEAKSLIDSDKELVILDVRTKDEYKSGHIAGSILIPHTEIEKYLSTVE